MKKIIAAVLSVAVLVGAGYFFYQNQLHQKSTEPKRPAVVPTAVKAPEQLPTSYFLPEPAVEEFEETAKELFVFNLYPFSFGFEVDYCALDRRGEPSPSEEFKRPETVYAITDKGSIEVEYIGEEQANYEVCGSQIPRKLWKFKPKENISTDKVLFLANFKIEKVIPLPEPESFKPDVDWIKRANEVIKNSQSVKAEDCVWKRVDNFTMMTCDTDFSQAYVWRGDKLVLKDTLDGWREKSIELTHTFEIDGKLYYRFKIYDRGEHTYQSIRHFTDELLEVDEFIKFYQCSLPTIC